MAKSAMAQVAGVDSTVITSAMVTGLFTTRDSAERAFRAALELGYKDADINLVMSDETRERYFSSGGSRIDDKATESADKPASGNELGGPAGGTMGTLAPVFAAVGTLLLVPGILIAGPVAVALTAAGAVGVAGGMVGLLQDWGVPKGRLEQYETAIRNGNILIGVKPRSEDDARELERRFAASGGVAIDS
jgi:hypothetical protein